MDRYVLAFAFSEDRKNVLLIKKNRVRREFAWMEGRFNGLGGKIREGEDYRDAMTREFWEESGLHVDPARWQFCGNFGRPGAYDVVVYRVFTDAVTRAWTHSPDEGDVQLIPLCYIELFPTVRALSWLVPLLMYEDLRLFQVEE